VRLENERAHAGLLQLAPGRGRVQIEDIQFPD
jgi:hypothetical protein